MEEQDIDIIDRILEDFGANEDDDIVDDAAKVEQFVLRAGEEEAATAGKRRDQQIYDTKNGRLGNDGIEKNTVEEKVWMQRRVPAKSINSDGSFRGATRGRAMDWISTKIIEGRLQKEVPTLLIFRNRCCEKSC